MGLFKYKFNTIEMQFKDIFNQILIQICENIDKKIIRKKKIYCKQCNLLVNQNKIYNNIIFIMYILQ